MHTGYHRNKDEIKTYYTDGHQSLAQFVTVLIAVRVFMFIYSCNQSTWLSAFCMLIAYEYAETEPLLM